MSEKIKAFLDSIKADYYSPTKTQPAYTCFWDYDIEAGADFIKEYQKQQSAIIEYAKRENIKIDWITYGYTKYIHLYV